MHTVFKPEAIYTTGISNICGHSKTFSEILIQYTDHDDKTGAYEKSTHVSSCSEVYCNQTALCIFLVLDSAH